MTPTNARTARTATLTAIIQIAAVGISASTSTSSQIAGKPGRPQLDTASGRAQHHASGRGEATFAEELPQPRPLCGMITRTEFKNGQKFRVTVLPAMPPPSKRSQKTRYRQKDVGKPGNK
jgi:hypothetical protein